MHIACAFAKLHTQAFCKFWWGSAFFPPYNFIGVSSGWGACRTESLRVQIAFLKPALLPLFLNEVRGTGSFILVMPGSWNCLGALGYQNRERSFHKTIRVPASQYVNSDLIPLSSELCIWEVFRYSLISLSPVSILRQGKRQKIRFSVAGVFCLRTTTFLRCMIQQVCCSTLGLSSYRVKS